MTDEQTIVTELRLFLLTQLHQSVELSDEGELYLHHRGKAFRLEIGAVEV